MLVLEHSGWRNFGCSVLIMERGGRRGWRRRPEAPSVTHSRFASLEHRNILLKVEGSTCLPLTSAPFGSTTHLDFDSSCFSITPRIAQNLLLQYMSINNCKWRHLNFENTVTFPERFSVHKFTLSENCVLRFGRKETMGYLLQVIKAEKYERFFLRYV